MSTQNVSKVCDNFASKTRIMEIFIQVEFGVTFSDTNRPREASAECKFMKRVKATASRSQSNEDNESKSKEVDKVFLTPRIRPLDLSGPFDKDQQELWIMQVLGRYNLSSSVLQRQIRPGIDFNGHKTETNEKDENSIVEGALRGSKDLDLFHEATLTVGTFLDDSDSDIECEKPWIFPLSDSDINTTNINLPLQFCKTSKKVKRYGIYRNLTTLW